MSGDLSIPAVLVRHVADAKTRAPRDERRAVKNLFAYLCLHFDPQQIKALAR